MESTPAAAAVAPDLIENLETVRESEQNVKKAWEALEQEMVKMAACVEILLRLETAAAEDGTTTAALVIRTTEAMRVNILNVRRVMRSLRSGEKERLANAERLVQSAVARSVSRATLRSDGLYDVAFDNDALLPYDATEHLSLSTFDLS